MSTLKVDSITDSAGTGAPDFPNGLTGKPIGISDGSSVPAGQVGEVISVTWASDGVNSGATGDVWVNANVTNLVLTAGVWLIGFDALVNHINVSNTPSGGLRIYNVTDASPVTGSVTYYGPAASTSVAIIHSKICFVNINATKTFRIEERCRFGSAIGYVQVVGSSSNAGLTDPDFQPNFYGVRIA